VIHISGQVTEPPEEQTRDATHEDGRVMHFSQYVTEWENNYLISVWKYILTFINIYL